MSSVICSHTTALAKQGPMAHTIGMNSPTHQEQLLLSDAIRLTSRRPFEPDYAKHTARLADDYQAMVRLAAAGYPTNERYTDLLQHSGYVRTDGRWVKS